MGSGGKDNDHPASASAASSTGSGLTRRGYSALNMANMTPAITGASTETNVLIKKALPARGIVSSNPKRIDRFLTTASRKGLISDIKKHTDSGWGIVIWTVTFHNVEYFIAVVPIGATGAGFAFFELFAAGAQAVLRFGAGSNANRESLPREIVVVDEASNMESLVYASGREDARRNEILKASGQLVDLLVAKASEKEMPLKRMICYNVEDYHAYNFSELFKDGEVTQRRIKRKEEVCKSKGKDCCWDMETAALFWRAEQFGTHAATVLVPSESWQTVELEHAYYTVMLESLLDFCPRLVEKLPSTNNLKSLYSRGTRKHSTNDFIGSDDPVFCAEIDVETGNNLFNDEESESFLSF